MNIKDSGDRTSFGTGAVRDMGKGKGRMDLLPWRGIMRVSKLCEAGAVKYGERNVDKGIPQHSLIDSAFRHLAKYTEGWDDEDHLVAAAWNILWALQQEEKEMEHLMDLPWQVDDREQRVIHTNERLQILKEGISERKESLDNAKRFAEGWISGIKGTSELMSDDGK